MVDTGSTPGRMTPITVIRNTPKRHVERSRAAAKHGCARDEERHRPLPVLLEGRCEEGPELPEEHWQREQEAGPEADHDRGRERLDRAERDGLLQLVRERPVEPLEQLAVERV